MEETTYIGIGALILLSLLLWLWHRSKKHTQQLKNEVQGYNKALHHHPQQREEVLGPQDDATSLAQEAAEQVKLTTRLAIRANELALLYDITTEVLQQTAFKPALKRCLDLVCTHMQWPIGHACLPSAEGHTEELVSSGIWHLDDRKASKAFREITEQSRFPRGTGLPGQAWEHNRVVWVEDLYNDMDVSRAAQGKELGVQSGIAFPVVVDNKVEAVLEFFSNDRTKADKDLLQVLAAVGCLLGDILERQRESQALAEAKEQMEALLQQRNQEIRSKEQIQHELEVNNQQLEQLIEWRTKELSEANIRLWQEVLERQAAQIQAEQAQHEAERANQAKSAFLANMSHELRTPMHAILSFSDFGLAKLESADRKKLGHYFDRIHTSGHRLLLLLNDLLDLSKLEAGKMALNLQACDPSETIRLCIEELHTLADERKQHIEVQSTLTGQTITADPERLLQVVRNLLSNAIKFSPEGETIQITLDTLSLSGTPDAAATPGIQIQVIDHGVGIPEDELEAVFDKFIQSSKTTTGAGGTGLGLAICREIVELHQGHIHAENREGGGAVFTIELPMALKATVDG
jgi:signal transduction histidine kinase